jgi:hypothetical protein
MNGMVSGYGTGNAVAMAPPATHTSDIPKGKTLTLPRGQTLEFLSVDTIKSRVESPREPLSVDQQTRSVVGWHHHPTVGPKPLPEAWERTTREASGCRSTWPVRRRCDPATPSQDWARRERAIVTDAEITRPPRANPVKPDAAVAGRHNKQMPRKWDRNRYGRLAATLSAATSRPRLVRCYYRFALDSTGDHV